MTIAAISQAAHVSIGSIYSHFSNKELLLLEIFLDQADAAVRAFLCDTEELVPAERARAAGHAFVTFCAREPALINALISGDLLDVGTAAAPYRERILVLGETVLSSLRGANEDEGTPAADTWALLMTFCVGLAGALCRPDGLAIPQGRGLTLLDLQLRALGLG